ncbi:MAG: T9SS type A sorting domain-containing protein, partial [Chitinophagales bacterium]|nr:T9SS type A sorting domain-containing protein [Chitinophagales bacterium]
VDAKDWNNEHYTAWWTPPAYGTYTMNIISTNNFGASNSEAVTFTVVDEMSDVSANAATEIHLNINVGEETVTADLPCYAGAFDEIIANLTIDCPNGGCDPWDRVSGVEVKGHNGEWYEIMRYITPYGIACNHSIDLTDFMSLLQGRVDFRFYLGTQGNGFLYTLDFDYGGGIPDNKYSSVGKLWNDSYNFGNMDNLQPCETRNVEYPSNASASKIKLVSTGHGWGANNTGNAAEFHNDTHHIWVNGNETFSQNNWLDCDPNPDGCNDQLGTWYFDRAGWCPGAIAPWFDFDMTPFISDGNVELRYIFDEDYVDLCNSSNPDCISGVTCDNCDDGFNPHLIVASYLISFGDMPLDDAGVVGVEEIAPIVDFTVYPNPSSGTFNLEFDESIHSTEIRVLSNLGQVLRVYNRQSDTNIRVLHLEDFPKGIYFVELRTEKGVGLQKIVIE